MPSPLAWLKLTNRYRAVDVIETDEPTEPETKEPSPYEQAVALDEALLKIITRDDESDYKKDGTPKANVVVAELAPEIPRPTANADR